MPSQKRYRQHQESNNSARFRDLPPRFKRQKSSTSAEEPSSSEATSLETQKTSNHSLSLKKKDLQELKSQAVMAPSYSSVYQPEGNSPQIVARAHVLQVPQVVTSASQWPPRINGPLILSPWDSRHFDRVTNIQPHHVPLGTHFGYSKSDSPPLSPWTSADQSKFSGHRSVTSSPTWKASNTNPCASQRCHSSSGYFNNENWVPTDRVKFQSSPAALWCASSPPLQQCNNSVTSPPQNQVTPSSKSNEISSSNKMQTNDKGMIDYSDPDIRTIEMLRELERVADEKESECDNFGTDRKSLVSHHLRMLMCAVDRYTEGIDDYLSMTTRSDEVTTSESYLSTPRDSPVHNETWTQKQVKETTQEAMPDLEISLWTPSLKESVWKGSAAEPVSSASVHLTVPAYSHEPLFSSPQASPVWKQQDMKSEETAAWDLWSSPSFDFSGVLIYQNAGDITCDPFGRFTDANERERKPLYQR